jgi:hypothetical protein
MSTDATPAGDGLPADLAAQVEAELTRDETLVWLGQPLSSRYARMSIPLVIMGVFFTGFSVFWILMAGGGVWAAQGAAGGAPGGGILAGLFGCFPLCGVPFLLIGLGMIASPWWMRRAARRTCYALTNRRAIIWEPSLLGMRQVRSYTASGLGSLSRLERADGSGDLVFEEFRTRDSEGGTHTTRRGFLAIANVREVEELLRKTLLEPGA